MESVNLQHAKMHLSRLVDRASGGEEIVITKSGKPMARLIRYEEPSQRRRGGQWKGLVRMGDDFDAPLPDEVQAAFRGQDR